MYSWNISTTCNCTIIVIIVIILCMIIVFHFFHILPTTTTNVQLTNSILFHMLDNFNQTLRYFDSPLIKYFNISLTLIDSPPCPLTPSWSASVTTATYQTALIGHHATYETYPGLEINTTIATVGYYGGTSAGVVQLSAQHAKLVHFFGQNETTNCFQLHILLQNTSSTTALVDIKVEGGLTRLGSITYCGYTRVSNRLRGCRPDLRTATVSVCSTLD